MAEAIRKRRENEDKYKWDLTHIFASDEAWEKAYDAAMAETEGLSAFDGHAAEDPKAAITAVHKLFEKISPVFEYAFLRKETDNADPDAQALKDKAMRLYVKASASASFLEPERLERPEERLQQRTEAPEMRD